MEKGNSSSKRPWWAGGAESDSPPAKNKSPHKVNEECRNFKKGMCNRGDHCRYMHSNLEGERPRSRSRSPQDLVGSEVWFILCQDYQKGRCFRHGCRYFHLNFEDEARFKETGEISVALVEQAIFLTLLHRANMGRDLPACKAHLKTVCKKVNCKLPHYTRSEYEQMTYESLENEIIKLCGVPKKKRNGPPDMGKPFFEPNGPPNPYPPALMDQPQFPPIAVGTGPGPCPGPGPGPQQPPSGPGEVPQTDALYHQNLQLQKEFATLKTAPAGELKAQVEKLKRENEELNMQLKVKQNWGEINLDLQEKLGLYEKENMTLRDSLSKAREEAVSLEARLQSQVPSWVSEDKCRATLTEMSIHAKRLKTDLYGVQVELSKLWGGGPPLVQSLRQAWDVLQTTVNALSKDVSSVLAPSTYTALGSSGLNATSVLGASANTSAGTASSIINSSVTQRPAIQGPSGQVPNHPLPAPPQPFTAVSASSTAGSYNPTQSLFPSAATSRSGSSQESESRPLHATMPWSTPSSSSTSASTYARR